MLKSPDVYLPIRKTQNRALRYELLFWLPLLVFTAAAHAGSTAPAGFWRGTGSVDRVSDLKWIDLVVRYDSDFSFTTDVAGGINGKATVRYTLRVGDDRLRTLLANTNALTNEQLARTPIGGVAIGSVLGMATRYRDLVGLEGSYNGGTVIRRGPIKGQVQGDRIHLEWAATPTTLPYSICKVF